MADTTARLALPLLVPGQAQKELIHNEALTTLDVVAQATVAAVGVDAPPSAPAVGSCWVAGTAPTGAWAGEAATLAGWTAGGWRFIMPVEGMAVWDGTTGQVARYVGGGWTLGTVTATRVTVAGTQVLGAQRAAVASPAGGTVVDTEARVALASVLAALRGHGLIAS